MTRRPGRLKLAPPPPDWMVYPTEILSWPVADPPKPKREEVNLEALAEVLDCDAGDLEPWTETLWGILYLARLAPVTRRGLRNRTAAQVEKIRSAAQTIRETVGALRAANATVSLDMMLTRDDAAKGAATLDEVLTAVARLEDAAQWARRREKAALWTMIAGTLISETGKPPDELKAEIDRRVDAAVADGLTRDGETPRPAERAIDQTVMRLALFFEQAAPDYGLPKDTATPRKYETRRGQEERLSAHLFLRFAVVFLRMATPEDEVTEVDVLGALRRGRQRLLRYQRS